MRISATGTWPNSPGRRHGGFTLVEIMVVLVIIGILIAGTVLSTHVGGGDRDMKKERDRIVALTDYMRDQAALQNREYGMRCFIGGYEFLVFDARHGVWQRLDGDAVTRARQLPPGIDISLRIEGRDIVLPRADAQTDELNPLTPQIMLFSSGDLNLFELTLQRAGGAGVRFAPAPDSDHINATELAASPA